MKSIMRSLLPALAIQLLLALSSAADKYTAPIDYGFGPLTISIDTEGEILTRCEKVDITLGGGFGPYKLVSVNAKNKSMPIKLKTDKTAVWEAAVSEGSHVAFNVTDRAGATQQTPLLEVKAGEDGASCDNSTLYMNDPVEKEPVESESASSNAIVPNFTVLSALFTMVLVPAIIGIVT